MARVDSIQKSICILVLLILQHCYGAIKGEAQAVSSSLPADEIEALQEIAAQIGKKDWNFSENPCSSTNSSSWMVKPSPDQGVYPSTVFCNCSFSGRVCHVQNISLQRQDLSGVLPPSLAKLPHIKHVDFSLNYLSGNIPKEWASMKLEQLVLAVNMLSGTIPYYLGNITTLIHLNMENNMFSGTVPSALGNLVNLDFLNLNSNYLTGVLPISLTNLSKLTVLKINSNNFTGRIPDFIKNWKSLSRLNMQSSGFEGPIPSDTISMLNNLTELRQISDLNNGEGSEFPLLRDMKKLKDLMLRSCNLFGPIPPYLSDMKQLRFLDLSFNKLEGNIPEFKDQLASLQTVYFTSNRLNGTIPNWIIARTTNYRQRTDLSYNNFSESSKQPSCTDTLNLFRSFSSHGNSTPMECMKDRVKPCSEDQYSLHINCGGNPTTVGGIYYEGDINDADSAKLIFPSDNTWGISNTGSFGSRTEYTTKNVSKLEMNNSELYTSARLSALSLTYYGQCLANGNYTVKLHFSEITIRDNKSSHSLSRRIFDVYIQDKLELRDFDIKKEAKGVDKELVKEFKAIEVKDKSIEIRFYWAGKGTTSGPRKGTFGPLISAISVVSEFNPPVEPVHSKESRNSHVIVIAAIVSVLCLICVTLGILWLKCHFNASRDKGDELRRLDLQTGFFSFRQIKTATNNFDPTNKIGEGGFGTVYKGTLSDGTIIAVKQLSAKSKQGNREFVNEIGMISGLQHPNLVRLYGCCIERNQLLLVYEYMENNNLARTLFEEGGLKLDWPTRRNICIGIARGLTFLHEESTLKVVHRDIKTTNVLLDGELNPKISDFGLAKLDEEENTHISTRIAGTIGYMAPEYALWGYLTYKADVYSFGVVALEIVAGKYNMKYRPTENYVGLVDWALVLQQKGDLMEFVDPKLESDFNKEEVVRVIKVALLCTNSSPALRPTMSAVLSMLEGHTVVPELIMDPSIYGDPSRLEAIKEHFEQITQQLPSETQSLIDSSVLVDSSTTSSQDHH
ncbi:probable LRR receptor-like serine/threonine-protein kinase At1g07650 isoform X4 [Ziziphus jujuba]|uniref:non-specific serine/threonine protein kinase n=1 Tax=Ziziphus jujuba TaxID=326968 RepID=A0ABM3ZVT5_ZIZJJ|nr:probable LRR receptor-like serine/threonine-protein kinase At1g07650 isoform X4 [Ziziphus jujuba]